MWHKVMAQGRLCSVQLQHVGHGEEGASANAASARFAYVPWERQFTSYQQ
jgi:hypothetical protein